MMGLLEALFVRGGAVARRNESMLWRYSGTDEGLLELDCRRE